jgi:hypothetical protein
MLATIVSLVISIAALAISYVALLYTARPKVRVTLLNDESFKPGQVVTLKFRVEMRSRLRRAASDLRIFVNFVPDIEPLVASYGSALELSDSNVRTGKGPSRYLTVTGIRVSREEPVPYEDFTIRAQMPSETGTFKGWITCFAHGSTDDCGVSHFAIKVSST